MLKTAKVVKIAKFKSIYMVVADIKKLFFSQNIKIPYVLSCFKQKNVKKVVFAKIWISKRDLPK